MSDEVFPRLTHAPLREAIVDIRLRDVLPATFVSKLGSLEGFPIAKAMKHGQFTFQISKDKPAEAKVTADEAIGQRYEREDASEVVQFRRNGLTYSILKNYTSWDVLRDAARYAWQRFLSISGPINVNRLAVRYINAIEIPVGADYDEYLTAAPRIPKPLPQIVNSFIQKVAVPFAGEGATAMITQTLETPAPAVLDIDVFSECSLDGASVEIWAVLEKLRSVKNRVFFASLTAKVLDLYK